MNKGNRIYEHGTVIYDCIHIQSTVHKYKYVILKSIGITVLKIKKQG